MLRVMLNTSVEGRVPMVPNYRRLLIGQKSYLGLRFDGSLGPEGGWVATFEVIDIQDNDPHFVEYIRHIRSGDLLALDAATAKKVGGGCVPQSLPQSTPAPEESQ